MKPLFLLILALAFTACAPFKPISNGVVINGLSDHVSDPKGKARTEQHFGAAIRKNDSEVGFAKDSRVVTDYLIYAKHRWHLPYRFFADAGGALYLGKLMGNKYPTRLKPIAAVGHSIPITENFHADVSYAPGRLFGGTDVAYLQFSYRIGN